VQDFACGVVDDSVGTRNTLRIVAIVNGAPHEGLLQESPNERDFTPLESCHAFLTSWMSIDPQDSLVSPYRDVSAALSLHPNSPPGTQEKLPGMLRWRDGSVQERAQRASQARARKGGDQAAVARDEVNCRSISLARTVASSTVSYADHSS